MTLRLPEHRGDRRWVAREMVGDRVTIAVTEVIDHHGQTIVRGRYGGDFDKANLPDEPVLTNYFTVRDAKIVTAAGGLRSAERAEPA